MKDGYRPISCKNLEEKVPSKMWINRILYGLFPEGKSGSILEKCNV